MKRFQIAESKPLTTKQKEDFGHQARAAGMTYSQYLNQAKTSIKEAQIYLNDVYQVIVRKQGENFVHLSIKRLDQKPIHDWRELQSIKNELVGPECEAIEIYPAESRLIDQANQYHLWACTDPTFRFPIGFEDGRKVGSNEHLSTVSQRNFTEKNAEGAQKSAYSPSDFIDEVVAAIASIDALDQSTEDDPASVCDRIRAACERLSERLSADTGERA